MMNRLFLKIIAEAEIAQHFKEGMVPGCITDIVQVIMLAASAHAFLGRSGRRIIALFQTGKDILERHHSRIHEHRSEEHTSELQSLMRSSYAVFCLNTKKKKS